MYTARWIIAGVLSFLFFETRAQIESQYFYSESFTMEDGLFHGVIGDMRIDPNGFLWLSTIGGLQLFDGEKFVNMNSGISGRAGSGNFNYDQEKDLYYIKQNVVYRLDTDHYLSDRLEACQLPGISRMINKECLISFETPSYLFITHPNDTLYRVDKRDLTVSAAYAMTIPRHTWRDWGDMRIGQDTVTEIPYIDENLGVSYYNLHTGKTRLTDIVIERSGMPALKGRDTIIMLRDQHVVIFASGKEIKVAIPAGIEDFSGHYFYFENADTVLVAIQNNIYQLDLPTLTWKSRQINVKGISVVDIKIRNMVRDKAGTLYLANFYNGFVKIYPSQSGFDYIGISAESKNFVKCLRVSEPYNTVLVGTQVDGLHLYDTNGVLKRQILTWPDGMVYPYISSIIKISDSRFLVAAHKVFDLNLHGETIELTPSDGINIKWIYYYQSVLEDPARNTYHMVHQDGILTVYPEYPLRGRYDSHDMGQNILAGVKVGEDLIFASRAGIYKRTPGNDLILLRQDVPDFGYVRGALHVGDGRLLLATDQGLHYIGTMPGDSISRLLFEGVVYSVLPGNVQGEYWFGTDIGLYRLNPDFSLNHFSVENGLQENEFNSNSCYKTPSGKLYFGGINGVTAFYPADIESATDPLRPYVSSISVNGEVLHRYVSGEPFPHLTLSHSENNIRIELLGKGSKSPSSYNYQYLLIGVSPTWVDMGRNNKINFHLAPGSYTFYYVINNGFNPAANHAAHFTIVIRPPLYQRWWFVTSAIACVMGLILYLFIQHKKKQTLHLMYEYQLNEKLQKERMRISRELHDNIGAQMATVKRNINFLVSQFDQLPKEQVETKMKDLENISTQINQELRDTIWATQNDHISVADFITRIKAYVFQTLGQESAFRVVYEELCDTSVILGPFLALNLHRICQETLNNAFKHSGASELTVRFEGNAEYFKLMIRDNGTGFNMDAIHEGFGLGNIRHRTAQIGASLYFNRGITQGSSLEVVIERLDMPNQSTAI